MSESKNLIKSHRSGELLFLEFELVDYFFTMDGESLVMYKNIHNNVLQEHSRVHIGKRYVVAFVENMNDEELIKHTGLSKDILMQEMNKVGLDYRKTLILSALGGGGNKK